MKSPDLARQAALALLSEVLQNRKTLAELGDVTAGLAPENRARAQRLCLATLRNLSRADAMLKPHLRKLPPPDILALLRLATVELCALGEAPHGVVNAAVTLLHGRGPEGARFTGLANAVLRKLAGDLPRWARLDPPALPGWLRGRLMSAYGKQATMRMEAAHGAGAPIDVSVKANPALWAETLGGTVLPTGSVRLPAGVHLRDLPGFETGDWWVQDAAAALAAKVLAPAPGERILDLCAAPGGKTLQMAAAGAEVVALDISETRLGRLRDNLARCGLAAQTVQADALAWQPEAAFDAILLDAPCSATGTIRRHPDLPFIKDAASLKELCALQTALLERALGWLKPGGRLVYATCSLLPDEGEKQLEAALLRHPGLSVIPPRLAGQEESWLTPQGALRLRPDFWPDLGGMDGFFIARLRKAA